MKNFPPEITDLTIDLLNGDWQSLYNCALVCRAWFPRSRYNLLRNIRLTKHSEALMLMHRFREACIPEDQSPRELSIVEDHAPDSRPFVHTVPSIFLRTTSSMMLESLSIDGIRWREGVVPPGHPFWSSLSQLTSLTSLTLDNCRFVNFRQFQRLVYVLPQLSHLKISRGTTWSRRKTPILHTHLPRLRQLEIDGCNRRVTSALLRWVCDTPTCQSLRQLVYEPPPRSRDALGDMAVALALAARIFSPQWDYDRIDKFLSAMQFQQIGMFESSSSEPRPRLVDDRCSVQLERGHNMVVGQGSTSDLVVSMYYNLTGPILLSRSRWVTIQTT